MAGDRLWSSFVRPAARRIFKEGSVQRILRGPGRGLRYKVFPEYGWSPLWGRWEREAQKVMKQQVMKGYVAYDVGANYGIHTILLARMVSSSGRVFAFEPVADIASALEENLALNGFSNVTCIQKALGARSGIASFVRGRHAGGGHLASETSVMDASDTSAYDVEVISLDDFVDEGHPPPDFIKIDIEGAEAAALEGGRRTIRRFRPILLIDLHTPEQDMRVGRVLSELGYTARRTNERFPIRDLTAPWPSPHGVWGQITAVPDQP